MCVTLWTLALWTCVCVCGWTVTTGPTRPGKVMSDRPGTDLVDVCVCVCVDLNRGRATDLVDVDRGVGRKRPLPRGGERSRREGGGKGSTWGYEEPAGSWGEGEQVPVTTSITIGTQRPQPTWNKSILLSILYPFAPPPRHLSDPTRPSLLRPSSDSRARLHCTYPRPYIPYLPHLR